MNALPTEIKPGPVQDWPLTVIFAREKFSAVFETAEDIRRWAATEYGVWNAHASGMQSDLADSLVQNRDRLTAVQQASDAEALVVRLKEVATEYWPSAGPLGTILG